MLFFEMSDPLGKENDEKGHMGYLEAGTYLTIA